MRHRYEASPHPHLFIEEIVDSHSYAALRFPDHLVEPGAKWGVTVGDPEYDEILADPGWRALHDKLRGPEFVHCVLRSFSDELAAAGCLVDPRRARLIDYVESREDKERAVLAGDGDPNELFTRLDFQSKPYGDYREFVHLDWARRVIGGVLFFSDADEEGMVGGELAFYRDLEFRDDRWCHEPELIGMFRPRHNSGVIFLNSNRAFHGPRRIVSLAGRRRWLYFTISSKVDIWPARSGRGVGMAPSTTK